MIPSPVRVAAAHLRLHDGEFRYGKGRPVLQHRYNTFYIEVLYGKFLYYVPAGALAWYMKHGEWPDKPVRHSDGNPLNFAPSNLRLATAKKAKAPDILLGRALNEQDKAAYSGVRAGGPKEK